MAGNREVFSEAINVADRFRWESEWSAASQEYERALGEFPDDVTARCGLGFCFMQMKQWQRALNEYENVLEHDPTHIIALSKTAELYGILNRREEAYNAYLRLADTYAQSGQGARAEAAWQKAVQMSPSNPEPHEKLAEYYFEKKEIASTIQQRLAAVQGYLLRNELERAQTQCEEILRLDGTNIQAQQVLAQIQRGTQIAPTQFFQDGEAAKFAPMNPINGADFTGSRQPIPNSSPGSIRGPENSTTDTVKSGNSSGGNTGIMGNMGSAGNFGAVSNPGSAPAMAGGGGMNSAPRKRITANQVTGVLKQAQAFQTQGRFNDAIDLCEQILESGFDRPDARYFLGWLYQEQQRWDEAIRQFQVLLNDPDYALSCYYALGQCYRARGDLRTATVHFDEAVDRVNLDALTMEESDQLVQLCQEAAEAHRLLGEQEQSLTVYNALLGFLRSRGWSDKVAQVEFMLQQAQNAPAPRAAAPSAPSAPRPLDLTQPPPAYQPPRTSMADESTVMYKAANVPQQSMPEVTPSFNTPSASRPTEEVAPKSPVQNAPGGNNAGLPDWLTGILNEPDQNKMTPPAAPAAPVTDQGSFNQAAAAPPTATSSSWLIEGAKPAAKSPPAQEMMAAPPPQPPVQPAPPTMVSPVPSMAEQPYLVTPNVVPPKPTQEAKPDLEALLSQVAGSRGGTVGQPSEALLESTATLPESVRGKVIQSMQDIQKYVNHGLLTPATEECLRVIDMAPQYLDVHQVLCEIYVRQGRTEQAVTKYAILVDTYVANGRIDDAVATIRRILQLEPNNITQRMRLIELLSRHGRREELLRERTLAAEAYLRLGYVDRALTELEQTLQESPTSVSARLNYALALQKQGRIQQAVAEYQRVLQIDPRNLLALEHWHIAMITTLGTPRNTTLEVLTRIRWLLRGEGQKYADTIIRDYLEALENSPHNADIHFSLGQLYQQSGLFDKAIDSYLLAMRDSSLEVIARASAGQCLLTQGKPEAAIQQFEHALQVVRRSPTIVDPATWSARPREEGEEHKAPEVEISTLLANAYMRTGRQEQAQAILHKLQQKRSGSQDISAVMADISARQGDVDGTLREYMDMVRHYRNSRQIDNALNVLNEMVRLAPQDPRGHEGLADIYINRGLLEEGIAELRLLADIYLRQDQLEQAAATMQRVGNLYAEMGDNEEAIANLSRAAELDSSSMDLLREVVGLCMQTGRTKDAAKYQDIIARHYFETHQVKEAVAALQQLIAIDRTYFDAYDMLGQTYQSVGEYEQASRVYKNLAKVNPGSSIARERLATLQGMRMR